MSEPEQHYDLRSRPSLVVLTGFRATGKTAVGAILADLLGYRFIDTDEEVSSRLGCSIAESVSSNGWQPFRDFERDVLNELAEQDEIVVATGGGSVLHRKAWKRFHKKAFVVWLRADVETIVSRLQEDKKTETQRPSLSGQDLETEIPTLLRERELLYHTGSDIVIGTENRTPAELAAIIVQKLAG